MNAASNGLGLTTWSVLHREMIGKDARKTQHMGVAVMQACLALPRIASHCLVGED
jgi:hypothetical protein